MEHSSMVLANPIQQELIKSIPVCTMAAEFQHHVAKRLKTFLQHLVILWKVMYT